MRIKRIFILITFIMIFPSIALGAQSFMPAEKTGKLYIYSEIDNVKIYVDNTFKAKNFVEIENIQAGTHYVKVMKNNKIILKEVATVKEGEVTTVIIREEEGRGKKNSSLRGGLSLVHTNFTYTQTLGNLSASENLRPNWGFDFNIYQSFAENFGIEAGYIISFPNTYNPSAGLTSINSSPFYFNALLHHDIFYGGGGINYSFWSIGAEGASLTGGIGYQLFVGLEGFNMCGEFGYNVMNGTVSGGGASLNHSMSGSYIKVGYKS